MPVVDVRTDDRRAGGAGLVASMLVRDGHDVTLVTVLSDDDRADEIRALLPDVRVVAALRAPTPDPVKTRVRCGRPRASRIDEGCATPPVPRTTPEMTAALEGADAIVVADYGRGVAASRGTADPWPRGPHDAVVWDPHPKGAAPVAGTAVVTPNTSEARRFTDLSGEGVPSPPTPPPRLVRTWDVAAVAVTMGDRGALVASRRGGDGTRPGALDSRLRPGTVRHPGDPCGAGDRLAAGVAIALAEGATSPTPSPPACSLPRSTWQPAG